MTPDRQFRSPVRHFWRWLIPALLLWAFALQGTRGLWSPDEGRYVDVALEMLKSGDWLRPHVNDEFAHVTKPPLTYWAVASSVELFGRHEWAARLPALADSHPLDPAPLSQGSLELEWLLSELLRELSGFAAGCA